VAISAVNLSHSLAFRRIATQKETRSGVASYQVEP